MITSEVYENKLKEIENLNYTDRPIRPDKEPVFNVYLNTRTIDVPDEFQQLAVEGDHFAETIWFTLDRYFDGQDLAQPVKKWAVQYINALGEENLAPIDYKYVGSSSLGGKPDVDGDEVAPSETLRNETTLKLGWRVHYDLTKAAGKVTIALRCFEPNTSDKLTYNLGTEPATLYIAKGLNITDENNVNLMNPPRDNLSQLVQRIEDLYQNNTLTGLDYNEINEITLPTIDGVMLKGGITSAEFTNISYNQLNNKPVITVDGVQYIIGGDAPIEVTKVEVDAELKDSVNPVQNGVINTKIKDIDAEIAAIKEELGTMTYIPLKINSFTNNVNLVEKNSLLNGAITFNWEIEGTVANQQITYQEASKTVSIDNPEVKTYTHDFGTITNNATFTLTARDRKDNPTTADTSIIFTYKVFSGASVAPSEFNADFITGLENGVLQTSSATTFSAVAEEGQYVYYAAPQEYGVNKNSFSVGGWVGGFGAGPIATITYNQTTYDIWQSDNTGLGDTTVSVV